MNEFLLLHNEDEEAPRFSWLGIIQFSCSVVSDSLWPHELQHARPPSPSPTPGVHSDSRPSSHWCILPSHPLSSPSPPVPNPSQHQSLFQWVSSSHEVAKVLEFQPQHHSFQRNPRADLLQNGLVRCLRYMELCRICLIDPLEKEMATLFLPGESHGQRSLEGSSPWGCRELDMTEHALMLLS